MKKVYKLHIESIDIKVYVIADSLVLLANAKLLKLSSGLELQESEIVINFVFEIKSIDPEIPVKNLLSGNESMISTECNYQPGIVIFLNPR